MINTSQNRDTKNLKHSNTIDLPKINVSSPCAKSQSTQLRPQPQHINIRENFAKSPFPRWGVTYRAKNPHHGLRHHQRLSIALQLHSRVFDAHCILPAGARIYVQRATIMYASARWAHACVSVSCMCVGARRWSYYTVLGSAKPSSRSRDD